MDNDKVINIGIVFAGQGAQHSGMGKDFYDEYSVAKKIFDLAGEQIKEWCFYGDEDILKQTNVTQPTIYVMTMAAYEALIYEIDDNGLKNRINISSLAGFSLGEYAALTAAGTIDDVKKGIEIVTRRGILMQNAGKNSHGENIGGMAVCIGERKKILEVVEISRDNGILEGVNYNSPVQTVVAGDKEALKRFRQGAKERKIKTLPLNVSTAFHSPMMKTAAEALAVELQSIEFKVPKIKVYSNVTAKDILDDYNGNDIKSHFVDKLAKQAMSPVYWEETIRNIEKDGVNIIIEVGPGMTLKGFINVISPDIKVFNVNSVTSLKETIESIHSLCI